MSRQKESLVDWSMVLIGINLSLLIVAFFFLPGCGPIRPPAPPTPPPVRVFDVVLCASADTLPCPVRIKGRAQVETAADVWLTQDTDAEGYTLFTVPTALEDTRLRLEADGYVARTIDAFHPASCSADCHNVFRLTPIAPPPSALPNAGEHLSIHIDGTTIRTSDGAVWRYAGITAFRLFKRFVDGEDIDPILTDYITCGGQCEPGNGPNTVRVLLSASVLFDLPTSATTPQILHAFLDKLDERGLFCECVVLVDANPDHSRYPNARPTAATVAEQQAFLDVVAPLLAAHWNVIGELCNECSHFISRVDRAAFSRPAGSILWERGSGQADEPPYVPTWDLVGHHDGRHDDWPRRLSCRDIRSTDGAPWGIAVACIENEDMGAADVDVPGRRSANADDMAQHAAHCALNANGCLFHPEVGLQTTLLTPVQAKLAAAFYEGLHFAPAEALLWSYRRGGLSGQLASCIVHSDDRALRTFSKQGPDGTCYTVAVRPTAGWSAAPADGRAVVAQPRRGLVVTR